MSSTKRLFVGIDLPRVSIPTFKALDPHLDGLRWVPGDQLHLTLSFIGEVDAAKQDALTEALGSVRVPPFFLPLQGMGSFNARGRPSVVWIGIGKGHPHLLALHKHIQDAVLRVGLEPDFKPFHPHVTVARASGLSRDALEPLLRQHPDTDFDLLHVTEFVLFSSSLRSNGAIHFAETRFKL